MRIEAFEQLGQIRVEIEKTAEMEEAFRAAAERMTNLLTATPAVNGKRRSRIEEYTVKLVQAQEGRQHLELAFLTMKMKWLERISRVIDDKLMRLIIRRRYIDGESWRRIAEEVNCSERQVFKLNREGLKKLQSAIDAGII